jgi:hypothetical protein
MTAGSDLQANLKKSKTRALASSTLLEFPDTFMTLNACAVAVAIDSAQ